MEHAFTARQPLQRRRKLATAALLAGGLLAAVGLGLLRGGEDRDALAADGTEVKIDNYSFSPGTLTVPVGTTVTWINRDETPHTVVAQDAGHSFRSGGLDTDDKFSFTFDKAGTYAYICTVHPYMTGKVVVQ
jgi:amicyanin